MLYFGLVVLGLDEQRTEIEHFESVAKGDEVLKNHALRFFLKVIECRVFVRSQICFHVEVEDFL